METSQGPPEAPGAPKSTGPGLGVVSGHPPQTQGNQALEAPLQFPKPSNSQEYPLESNQWIENGLQAALQAQLATQPPEASLGGQLTSGLTGINLVPIGGSNGVASSEITEDSRQKRVRQDSEGGGAYPTVTGPVRDYVIGTIGPIQTCQTKHDTVLKGQASLIQALIARLETLERTVRELQAREISTPSASSSHDVIVSGSPPRPEPEKGLAPTKSGLTTTEKGPAPPPQYQDPENHQEKATPAPRDPQATPAAPKTANKPLVAPPKPAPKSWVSTAGNAQQANAGEWTTVQYGKQTAKIASKPISPPTKSISPPTKPISTRSKEERRLIFRRQEPATTVREDTRNILLWLNRALDGAGLPIFMRAVDSGYAASGHLTVLLKEGTPSNTLVPAYNDMLIAAVRRVDPAVVSVEISEQWQRVKVHRVPIQRYMNSNHGLELAREEIELVNSVKLKRDPTWLKSPKALRAGNQRFSTIVVTVGSREEARGLLKAGLEFGGHHYKTEAYLDTNPESVCARCCGIGHSSYWECKNQPPKCTICAGDHEALSHKCNVVGCTAGLAKSCQHCPIRCANCGESHVATSPKCPKIKQARKQAIQRARDRTLQHLIPASQSFGIIVPNPPQALEPLESREELISVADKAQSSLGTEQTNTEMGEAQTIPSTAPEAPLTQESC
jgi:hypothetical protein